MNRIGDNLICGSNEEIVKVFSAFDVEFILVGGLAISWYCSSRKADDIDILVNPTKENSGKIANALRSLRLVNGFTNDSFASPGIHAPIKQFYHCDIITPARNGLTFERLMESSIIGKLFNIPVHIPSVENLILMKEGAVSSKSKLIKDQQDIDLLRSHLIKSRIVSDK
ncbi:MAG: hypothetical protein M0R47_02350 [Methylobacter sp.]|uniref:hypothetical protein n=1 Tax=Methylobacter sp. TaxID=2051955 RepID=UPI0025D28FCE|nr:hypothetical protein [Methylobacter sp.]MCK9619354.1 hypothetical protein [Methylobacter sp.]